MLCLGETKRNKMAREKHKLKSDGDSNWKNVIVVLVILGIIGLALYWIVPKVLTFIGDLLSRFMAWLQNLNNSVDAVIIVAVFAGATSLLTLFVTKKLEFKNKRQEYFAQKREVAYGQFVSMVYKVMDNAKNPGTYPTYEMVRDMQKFSETITLWGSKTVAKKWIKFRTSGSRETDNGKELLFVLEDIMNSMRKDLGLRRTCKGGLLGFFVNDIDDYVKNKKK